MGLGELIGLGITLTSQTVDDGSSRIAQSHHLRTFVDSLTSSIVDGLSQHLHIVIGAHQHNL